MSQRMAFVPPRSGFLGFQDFPGSFGDQVAHAGGRDGVGFARKLGRPMAAFQNLFNSCLNGARRHLHAERIPEHQGGGGDGRDGVGSIAPGDIRR